MCVDYTYTQCIAHCNCGSGSVLLCVYAVRMCVHVCAYMYARVGVTPFAETGSSANTSGWSGVHCVQSEPGKGTFKSLREPTQHYVCALCKI